MYFKEHKARVLIPSFFVLLFLLDWFLYFRHAGHFFQADTVWLLDHRVTSARDLLLEFTKLQASNRFRPLSHPLLPSILYPIFGLSPLPHRIPIYALFFADTIAVYALVVAISRNRLAAAIATFFFSIHTVNAYTTYDVGFTPELLYTLFYIVAVLGYLRYLETGSRGGYLTSIACFVGSLFSKEAAVTLPLILVSLHFLNATPSEAWRERLVRSVRSTLPHTAILAAYMLLVVGWLNTIGTPLTQLFRTPERPEAGAYQLVFDETIFKNADLALTWVFNIPRGWIGQWRNLSPTAMAYLKGFRLIVLALSALLLFRRERKIVLFGIGWFFVTLFPVLPLLNHLMPYYLFLPVIGLSLVIGFAFSSAYDALKQVQPVMAAAAIAIIFVGVLVVTAPGIRDDIEKNRLLGGSAELALNSVKDLKALYPTLPSDARIYFDDADEPLGWDHSWGGLIRMAYNLDRLSVRYASEADLAFMEPDDRNFVLGVRNKHLVDKTADYRIDPERLIHYKESETYKLEVSPTQVTFGDTYAVTIRGLQNARITFVYRLNDEAPASFRAHLDANGRATFNISAITRKGVYKFLGFTVPGESGWMRSDKTVVVR
jgi:hypothetical protein